MSLEILKQPLMLSVLPNDPPYPGRIDFQKSCFLLSFVHRVVGGMLAREVDEEAKIREGRMWITRPKTR